jgi:hypothetical protein
MPKKKKAAELTDAEVFKAIFPKEVREELRKIAVKTGKKQSKK